MKKEFIQSLFKSAVKYQDYLPLRDEEGNIYFNDKVSSLVKDSLGTVLFLEFIDGDGMSAEEIRLYLESSAMRLQDLAHSRNSHTIAEIFIFDHGPSEEKTDVIISGQVNKAFDKLFIKCFSVNLENKEFIKYDKRPLTDYGIGKLVKRQFDNAEDLAREDLADIVRDKEKEYKVAFKSNRAVLTYILIGINLLIWAGLTFLSTRYDTSYNSLLFIFGAKDNGAIIAGQYWRFITPIFLHGGFLHVALNCYSLYALSITEKIYGHAKFIIIYILAGILGNIASFAFLPNMGVGASGAIFGLLGAMLYFGIQRPAIFKGGLGYNITIAIVMNLAYGFTNTGIDNAAHIGGLVGGFLVSGIIGWPVDMPGSKKDKWYLNRLIYIPLALIITAAAIFYGFGTSQNKIAAMLQELEQYAQSNNWSAAEAKAEAILLLNPADEDTKTVVLWELTRAEAISGKPDEAMEHAQQLVKVSPAEGYYLVGILYYDRGEPSLAYDALQAAKNAGADYENLDKIMGEIGKELGK